MSEIKANTERIKEYGEELVKISDDVADEIDLLFAKIEGLITKGIWQGYSAHKYYQKVMPDKETFKSFNEEFRKYGTHLLKCSERLKTMAKVYEGYNE